jgi:hypothetical protein
MVKKKSGDVDMRLEVLALMALVQRRGSVAAMRDSLVVSGVLVREATR